MNMQMMMLGSVGGVLTNPINASASNSSVGASSSSTAIINFQSNGTITGSAVYTGPTNWYTPSIANIGAQFWISFDGGAWLSLSTVQTSSLSGKDASSTRTVRISSDSAGVNIVASGTLSFTVSNSG